MPWRNGAARRGAGLAAVSENSYIEKPLIRQVPFARADLRKLPLRNIAFELNWVPAPLEIPARARTCSFCTKHGGVRTSCPTGSLKVTIKDPSQIGPCMFENRT